MCQAGCSSGCLLGVLLLLLHLLLLTAAKPVAGTLAPGPPRTRPRTPQNLLRADNGVRPWGLTRAHRPPAQPGDSSLSYLALPSFVPGSAGAVLYPPLEPGPTRHPGKLTTVLDPSFVVRNTRSSPSDIKKNFQQHHLVRYQLYSENAKKFLQLLIDGTVKTTSQQRDPYTLLHIRPIQQDPWVAEIRSQATGLFLCMNRKGILYSSCNRSSECEFLGNLEATYYDSFRSVQFSDRYIAIATDGRVKKARRVKEPKGRLSNEHFFLPRQLPLKDVHKIINQHQQNLPENETPQRCAGFAETYTTQPAVMTQQNTKLLPVNVTEADVSNGSVTTPTITTTSTSRPTRLKCKVINGQRRCRKRRRPCKSKKCRIKRRKEREKNKEGKESSERRGKQSSEHKIKESSERRGKESSERKRNKDGKRKHLRKSTNKQKSKNTEKVVGETEFKRVENEAKDNVSDIRSGDSIMDTSESEIKTEKNKQSQNANKKTNTGEVRGGRRHDGRRKNSRTRGKLRSEQRRVMPTSQTERRIRHKAHRRLLFHQTSIGTTTPIPQPVPTSPIPTYINVVLSRPTAGTNSIFKVDTAAPRPFPSAPSSAVPRRRQQRMRHKGVHLSQRRRPRGRIIFPTSSSV